MIAEHPQRDVAFGVGDPKGIVRVGHCWPLPWRAAQQEYARAGTRAKPTGGRRHSGRALTAGALAIATTGIWVMHFIAMLGFAIPGQTIRYNVVLTIVSMLIAVLVVGIGTFLVGFSQGGTWPLLVGGLVLGIGVALSQTAQVQPGRGEPGSLFRPHRPKIQP